MFNIISMTIVLKQTISSIVNMIMSGFIFWTITWSQATYAPVPQVERGAAGGVYIYIYIYIHIGMYMCVYIYIYMFIC